MKRENLQTSQALKEILFIKIFRSIRALQKKGKRQKREKKITIQHLKERSAKRAAR
jgi:hypothetical protein